MKSDFNGHVSAERLQAFLEGILPGREESRVEEHVAVCARCSEELDTWRVLFDDLADLPSHDPHGAFGDRVMAAVRIPERVPLAARIRERLASLLPALPSEHLAPHRLQDFVEGLLPGRQMARVEAHLGECAFSS